ncbi:hypothetical protein, partial [Morganella morganii]|uniref:hypothetical protein n=1 Tax=Morganella morganii TaxID=582 RepID=UPI003305A39E
PLFFIIIIVIALFFIAVFAFLTSFSGHEPFFQSSHQKFSIKLTMMRFYSCQPACFDPDE